MITPELVEYIRGELAKGRAREEIVTDLMRDGGWNEVDVSEAFKATIPTPSPIQSSLGAQDSFLQNPKEKSSLSFSKVILFIVVFSVFCFVLWFFRVPLVNIWNSLPYVGVGAKVNVDDTEIAVPVSVGTEILIQDIDIKNCGTSIAPNLKNPFTYENDIVLSCLGESALFCTEALAVLEDDSLPTIFKIVKNQDTCNFELSYTEDSTLVDVTGKKLASQYIFCPIYVVKNMDDTKNPPLFLTPVVENLSKYAALIHFYGTVGIFIENDINKNKIQNLGCSGSLIDSIIANYNKIKSS